MSTLASFYKGKADQCTADLAENRKKLYSNALFRLAVFLALVASVYYLVKGFSYPLLLLSLLLLAGFIGLVNLTFRLKDRQALLEKLLFLQTNEIRVLEGGENAFGDGQSLLRPEGYLDDLDIFGKFSLFHYLNRTTTSHGMETLAGRLQQPLPEEIERYQQAVRVLASQVDNRQLMIAYGLLNQEKKENLFSLQEWLSSPSTLLQSPLVRITAGIIMAFNTFCLVWWAATGNFRPLLAGILAGWLLTGIFARYLVRQHQLLGKKQAILDQYGDILQTFGKADSGDSELLQQLQRETGKACTAIKRLARLSSYFDQQTNMVVSFVLNNLFLYNLQCLIALEKWKEKYKADFPEWVRTVGNIEYLNSIAGYAFNNPSFAYPTPLRTGELSIEAHQLAHPLIPEGERIANDLSIGKAEKLALITGSNMSGKTTFLRTVGVNLLLAQCGAPVCATKFSFTPMQILSSLRISDSLQDHTSYFMAELKKLQQIIRTLQSNRPALVLIDEILRGTNSEDKAYGSHQFIIKLLQYPCLSLFATHDLSLGVLEKEHPGAISNYCFESVIENGELHFNYLLQRGIARNRNASFLMQKMEII